MTRKLTMTCWHLRNILLPLLWEYVEGCNLLDWPTIGSRRKVPLKYGLYAQCSYLLHNPTICACVRCVHFYIHSNKAHSVSLYRVLSADLGFREPLGDFVTKFINCLLQLPNLRTLEIHGVDYTGSIKRVLRRKYVQLPSILELRVSGMSWHHPNQEGTSSV